ncbi:threonine-phosphate decarboxylase CobD [Pseudalkalibacillus salsuginis]|uniref:threonine-phosphate decarboxylase CobD n=1 Tax=Pseudalkalibacillus salsuginis TaxID=2910972 RepID=UPI001F000C36|nr:threonine-phosphate decarboxylase CobD [Pseudalkalibacillus salsuginis]MCF6411681.1 threonine-phosphate decarboxylase CobD [Pseudalkalibacillus salsuginis]
MNWPSHGSNPNYLYEALDLPKPEILIDFSANINPLGPPPELEARWMEIFRRITDYPDPDATELKKTISEIEQVEPPSILIGNGGADLISLVSRMLSGKNVLIIQPTFSEYEKNCHLNGCKIHYHHLEAPDWEMNVEQLQNKLKGIDALFLCNPNNPTGVQYHFESIIQLLKASKEAECLFVLDEAFYDMVSDYEPIIPFTKEFQNLIIIRSMTKMFAIPGLRLGYMIAHPEIVRRIKGYQTHWSVNVPALAAGEICLKKQPFMVETSNYIGEERRKLFTFFKKERYAFSPSKANFYLLKDTDKEDQLPLLRHLLRNGIVPRHTYNFPGLDGRWLRFGIKHSSENDRLIEVLKQWRQHHQ